MPATTPLGIPYPLSTEAPAGHTQMQSLATKVDQLLDQGFAGTPYAMAAGTISLNISGATQGTATITFPAARFTQNPLLIATIVIGTSTVSYVRSTGTINASGAGIAINTAATVTATHTVHWIAIQMTSAGAPG